MKNKLNFNRIQIFSIIGMFLMLLSFNAFYFFELNEKRFLVLINNLLITTIALILLKNSLSKIFGYFLLFILIINNFLELFSIHYYKSSFNIGMALSILNSNKQESFEMSISYWNICLIGIFFLILFSSSSLSLLSLFTRLSGLGLNE